MRRRGELTHVAVAVNAVVAEVAARSIRDHHQVPEDRGFFPWHMSPEGVTDPDEATWYAIRRLSELSGDGVVLPRQSMEVWVARMRASRQLDEVRYLLDCSRQVGEALRV